MRSRRGSPAALHAADLPVRATPTVWVMEATSAAIVLGSTQAAATVDAASAAAAGLAVARRRSGGGAVLVRPGEVLWLDVVIPRGDARWDDDVVRSSAWLGALFVEVLAAVGLGGAVAHTGPLVRAPWSRLACFAALGPGEVSLEGRKVVGISQRRTREMARFQCALMVGGNPAELADHLVLPTAEAAGLRQHLASRAGVVRVTSATVLRTLRDLLPT